VTEAFTAHEGILRAWKMRRSFGIEVAGVHFTPAASSVNPDALLHTSPVVQKMPSNTDFEAGSSKNRQ
jgi:hypothetical protein